MSLHPRSPKFLIDKRERELISEKLCPVKMRRTFSLVVKYTDFNVTYMALIDLARASSLLRRQFKTEEKKKNVARRKIFISSRKRGRKIIAH